MADAQYTIDTSDLARTQNELKQWAATNRKAVSSIKSDMVSVGRVQDMWAKDQKRRMALINNSRKLEERAAKAQAAETQKLQREYDKYRASIDDVFAAQQKYNSLVLTITQRNKSLGVSTEKTTKELEELKQKFQEIGVVINRNGKVLSAQNRNFSQFGTVTAKGGKSMSRFNMIMQQGGFQLQDFIVQLQGGTSIFTAFSQQGSQFAGIFGPTGAIVGAVIALGSALGGLAFGLRESSEEAKTLQEEMESLGSTLTKLESIQLGGLSSEFLETVKLAKQEFIGLLKLMEEAELKALKSSLSKPYEALVEKLKEFQVQSQLQRAEAPEFTALGLKNLSEGLFVATQLRTIQGETREELQLQLEAVREALSLRGVLTEEVKAQLVTLADQLGIVDKITESVEKQASVQSDIQNGMQNVAASQTTLTEETSKYLSEMEEVFKAAQDLKEELGEATFEMLRLAGVDITSPIDSAVLAAAKLATQLGISVNRLKSIQNARVSKLTLQEAQNPTITPIGPVQKLAPELFSTKATKTRSGVGGGGGGGSRPKADPLADIKAEIARREELLGLFGQERSLREEILSVEDALGKERGKYSDEFIQGLAQQRIALKQLEEEQKKALQQQQALTDSIAGSFGDAFSSVVDGTKTVEDAFRDMAKSIIKQLFEVLVVQRLVGSFNASTGQGSGLAGLIGPALGGLFADGAAFKNGSVQAFASGGVVDSPTFFGMSGGQTGLMGEAGPEAIMPLKRGPDGKLGVTTTGGQRPINITMNISTPDVKGFEKSRTQIASGLQQSLAQGGRNS